MLPFSLDGFGIWRVWAQAPLGAMDQSGIFTGTDCNTAMSHALSVLLQNRNADVEL